MPRNAFLGMPRIWFSLRSLNRRKRGTELTLTAGRLCLHLITITKPRAGCWGDCLVSGPRLPQACALFLGDGLCRNGYQGEPSPPGRALWVVSHLQARSQAAGLFVAHTAPNSEVLPPPRDDPLPLLPHVSLPHSRVSTSASPISWGPAAFVVWGGNGASLLIF